MYSSCWSWLVFWSSQDDILIMKSCLMIVRNLIVCLFANKMRFTKLETLIKYTLASIYFRRKLNSEINIEISLMLQKETKYRTNHFISVNSKHCWPDKNKQISELGQFVSATDIHYKQNWISFVWQNSFAIIYIWKVHVSLSLNKNYLIYYYHCWFYIVIHQLTKNRSYCFPYANVNVLTI